MGTASLTPKLYLNSFISRFADVFIWLLYNVFIGTAFLWLSWLLIFITPPSGLSWTSNIINGSLAVFIVTLCGTQAGTFAEMTGQPFATVNKAMLAVFVIIVILASFLAALCSTESVRKALSINDSAVITITLALFVTGVTLCLILYVTRLISQDFQFDKVEKERLQTLSQTAQNKDSVDGMKI